MPDKDVVSKHLLKRIAIDMAIYLFNLEVNDAELLETEFQRVEDRRADLLLQVNTPQQFLLHIEVQNDNHAQMPLRMLRYRLDIHSAHPELPIYQYVVYIGRHSLRMSNVLQQNDLNYRYHLIDMREIDCQHFLQHDSPDALVLAILCDFKGREPRLVVRHIIQRLQNQLNDNSSRLREYFAMLEILSGNRQLQTFVDEEKDMLSAIDYNSLPSYQAGRQEGEQLGLHSGAVRFLKRLLKKKFGELPQPVEERLNIATEQQLEQWSEAILTAETLEDVFRL
jgi:hypothetical protein